MDYNGESLSDEEFTIIEERPRVNRLDRQLRAFCCLHDGHIRISEMTNDGYDRLSEIYDNVPDEDFSGCIMSKHDLYSILSRYRNRFIEPLRKSKELRAVIESDFWGGIEGLFTSVDEAYDRIINDRYGRSGYPYSETIRLVEDGLLTISDLMDSALLVDYSNRGMFDISPKEPDADQIESWLRLLDKLDDIEHGRSQ